MKYTIDDFACLIDHTNLHADASNEDMKKLCDEAKKYHFKMVAINQVQSKFCSEQLKNTDIDTGAAIAFPLGQQLSLDFLLVHRQVLQKHLKLLMPLKMVLMKLTM